MLFTFIQSSNDAGSSECCHAVLCPHRQEVVAKLMADKALSAASIKELQTQLEQEFEQIRAARKAAVQAKKEAIRREQEQRGTKLQQYKAARVQLVRDKTIMLTRVCTV